MSNVWKMFQEKKEITKHMQKRHKHSLVPSQRYQDSWHLLQNPTVVNYVMSFSNRTQRFTGSNYLDAPLPWMTLYIHYLFWGNHRFSLTLCFKHLHVTFKHLHVDFIFCNIKFPLFSNLLNCLSKLIVIIVHGYLNYIKCFKWLFFNIQN